MFVRNSNISQSTLTVAVLMCAIMISVNCSISHPEPHDYNYPSTVLLNKSGVRIRNETYELKLPFTLIFQGVTYDSIWFSTDSVVSFGEPFYRSRPRRNNEPADPPLPHNYISVAHSRLIGKTVIVRTTSTNVTIEFCGQSQSEEPGNVCYIFTYYDNGSEDMFDIDIRQNDMVWSDGVIEGKRGFMDIDTKTVQLLRYRNVQLFPEWAIPIIVIGGVILIVSITALVLFVRSRGCSCASCCSTLCKCLSDLCCCLCKRRSQQAVQVASQQSADNFVQVVQAPVNRKELVLKHDRQRPMNDNCSVCQQPGTEVQTSCYHRFHLSCLRRSEEKSKDCPRCKQTQQVRFVKCLRCAGFTLAFPKGTPLPSSCNEFCCEPEQFIAKF